MNTKHQDLEIAGPFRHPLIPRIVRWLWLVALVGLLVLALWVLAQTNILKDEAAKSGTMIRQETSRGPKSPYMSEDALCGMDVVECSENLTSASPKGLARAIEATVTTYQAVSSQTDASPCIAASGLHVCPPPYPVVATNILPLGAKVKIRGQVYVVADRMNHRYDGVRIFDVLTDGENYILKNEPVTVL